MSSNLLILTINSQSEENVVSIDKGKCYNR